jgi:acyl carrier protein
MPTTTAKSPTAAPRVFPTREVETRLREELEKARAESRVLKGEWEPALDSLRMVSVVLTLEDLFNFELEAEKLVRKGGYASVDEALEDMTFRARQVWDSHQAKEKAA